MRVRGAAAAAAAGAAVVLAGCGGGSSGTPAAVVTASADASGVQVVHVVGTAELTFSPSTIVVHPGKVRIVFRSATGVPHTLEIPALHVSSGTTEQDAHTVDFTVTTPGSYEIDCAFHPAMRGRLVVR